MPYWITETLAVLPAFAWVYLLLGVPLALVVLPHQDWRDRPTVLMTAFVLGPAALTAWMLLLGSLPAALLTRGPVFSGLAVLTALAWGLWLWQRPQPTPTAGAAASRLPFTIGERLLLTMIAVAVAVRLLVMAYWGFTAYDALWVYGYQGRLYFLEGLIPTSIDYYPQFIPLQYTFGQLAYGGISDSAARAAMPFLHIGSILAAYSLGARIFNRRAGIFLAALWGLYPAVGEWARMGDLEIPLAFTVTAAAAFFFQAWREPTAPYARRYALLAGLVYGVALWTKPTAGGFALGIVLINATALALARFDWTAYRPRFAVSLWTALACAPLGGVWYLRNLLLGHAAVDFPPTYWYTLAERGGGQMLWYTAGLVALAAYLANWRKLSYLTGFGTGLVVLAITPSALARFIPISPDAPVLWLLPSLDGLPRMGQLEWALLLAGLMLVAVGLYPHRHEMSLDGRLVGWVLLATLPYFALYFWRYSYHYRLSFAIVPMIALPIAVILANWLPGADVRAWRGVYRWGFTGGLFLAALPGIVLPFYDPFLGWNYLWSGELADDTAKRESGNEALMWMVDGFNVYEQENGEPPSVIAPGVQRLPFFFPQADIEINTAPTRLHEIEDVVYYVDSHPDGTGMYEDIPIDQNQVWAALGRRDIMRWAWGMDDGIFRYDIYELHIENRYTPPSPNNRAEGEVRFGDYAQFLGHDIVSNTFEIGQRRVLTLYWEVMAEPERDYMTYIHLRDGEGEVWQAWDGPVALQDDGRYYTTLVWEPGEYIADGRGFRLTNEDVPPGEGYNIVIGMYDLVTNERVPVAINGETVGDGYPLDEAITVIPPQE
jgi:4-amino-4-deoxy-L-arabinose transferase-like glycosyltransferase